MCERPPALFTFERFFTGVKTHMGLEGHFVHERLLTVATGERLLFEVAAKVTREAERRLEPLVAQLTLVRFLSGVNPHV